MNTETLTVHPKGDDFEIVVEHDQTGSAYGITLSKSTYEQLRLHFVVESKPSTKAALNASVSAIYFADNSDYKSYHYEVIRSLTKLDEPTDDDITRLFKELNPE